jgi:hypothetical protein
MKTSSITHASTIYLTTRDIVVTNPTDLPIIFKVFLSPIVKPMHETYTHIKPHRHTHHPSYTEAHEREIRSDKLAPWDTPTTGATEFHTCPKQSLLSSAQNTPTGKPPCYPHQRYKQLT